MKWREKKNRGLWYTGPSEGEVTYYARKRGTTYEVRAAWSDPLGRRGPVIWWSFGGKGNNKCWPTKEAAQAWCERDVTKAP